MYSAEHRDWVVAIQEVFKGIEVPDEEELFFAERMLVLLTSCREKMDTEYEQVPWWTFIEAERHSASVSNQTMLGKGLTRSCCYGLMSLGGFDRLLNGPTSDVWLTPWVRYLRLQGAHF